MPWWTTAAPWVVYWPGHYEILWRYDEGRPGVRCYFCPLIVVGHGGRGGPWDSGRDQAAPWPFSYRDLPGRRCDPSGCCQEVLDVLVAHVSPSRRYPYC